MPTIHASRTWFLGYPPTGEKSGKSGRRSGSSTRATRNATPRSRRCSMCWSVSVLGSSPSRRSFHCRPPAIPRQLRLHPNPPFPPLASRKLRRLPMGRPFAAACQRPPDYRDGCQTKCRKAAPGGRFRQSVGRFHFSLGAKNRPLAISACRSGRRSSRNRATAPPTRHKEPS